MFLVRGCPAVSDVPCCVLASQDRQLVFRGQGADAGAGGVSVADSPVEFFLQETADFLGQGRALQLPLLLQLSYQLGKRERRSERRKRAENIWIPKTPESCDGQPCRVDQTADTSREANSA